MKKMSKRNQRSIVPEFALEICTHRKPTRAHEEIFFRSDQKFDRARRVYLVPIEYLRFRKDNGRIASDVLTYEARKGVLNETSDYGQSVLRGFLARKDPEKTSELKNSILKYGQLHNAVITADGFLINGNRRKLVLDDLYEKHPNSKRFRYLKVVILPGFDDDERPPTQKEIEQIENRYQLQTLGRAEYYNFDKAISIKRKIENGFSLVEQLRDDPNYASLNRKEFRRALRQFEEEYLEPLNCVDRYLYLFDRPAHYNTISEGRSDSRGRWQAFLDYYKSTYKKMSNTEKRKKLNLTRKEVESVEHIAFVIIRKRELTGLNKKVHQIMRELPKLLLNPSSKKELFKLKDKKKFILTKEEIVDGVGHRLDESTKDIIWNSKYGNLIAETVTRAYAALEIKQTQDTPLVLLSSSLAKLNNRGLDLSNIKKSRWGEALEVIKEIETRIRALEQQLRSLGKNM